MKLFRTGLVAVAWSAMLNPALAQNCVSQKDAMAMKTAAVQQQMMVAGFMCDRAASYNRFVRAYQSELRTSDAALKAHFVRTTGREAAYDTFKSKVANGSALSQSRNGAGFCNATDQLFAAALETRSSLAVFVSEAPSPPGFREACIVNAGAERDVRLSDARSR